jgi:hypothetical protein
MEGNGKEEMVEVEMAAPTREKDSADGWGCSLGHGSLHRICMGLIQAAFGSLALSLLATGCLLTSIAAGVRTPLATSVLIYTCYASLAAMGLVVVVVILLNLLMTEDDR